MENQAVHLAPTIWLAGRRFRFKSRLSAAANTVSAAIPVNTLAEVDGPPLTFPLAKGQAIRVVHASCVWQSTTVLTLAKAVQFQHGYLAINVGPAGNVRFYPTPTSQSDLFTGGAAASILEQEKPTILYDDYKELGGVTEVQIVSAADIANLDTVTAHTVATAAFGLVELYEEFPT